MWPIERRRRLYSPNVLERLSEKGRKSLRCSLMDHRNGTFRPIFASPHRLNPRFEGCSYPFSDSLGKRILGSSLPTSNAQVTAKLAHLSDTPAPIREYGANVTDKGTP